MTKNDLSQASISHLLYATEVFSHGWNDPSEILPGRTSIILDCIPENENPELRFHKWNKFYYDNLSCFYSLTEEQLEQISPIINIDKDKHRELYQHWPEEIDTETYHQLHNALKIDFVASRETAPFKGQYAIILNKDFWDVVRARHSLLTDIVHTYERHFEDYELLHSSAEIALEYAIIIYDRLCMSGRTETLYFYHELLREKSGTTANLPEFDYNGNLYKPEDKKAEYDRIRSERKQDIQLMKEVLAQVGAGPFGIIGV